MKVAGWTSWAPVPNSPYGLCRRGKAAQSSGAVWKSRWTSWAPVPNKPTVSVDVKQHFNNDVKQHCELEQRSAELRSCVKVDGRARLPVPNSPYPGGRLCGRKTTLNSDPVSWRCGTPGRRVSGGTVGLAKCRSTPGVSVGVNGLGQQATGHTHGYRLLQVCARVLWAYGRDINRRWEGEGGGVGGGGAGHCDCQWEWLAEPQSTLRQVPQQAATQILLSDLALS